MKNEEIPPAMIPFNTSEIGSMKVSPAKPDVTRLLLAWGEGDSSALDQLVPLVYQELRRQARYFMAKERQGHTLQATALVNEAYVRLVDVNRMQWQSRAHFFGVAAQMMRRILVESARSRSRKKRGGDPKRLSLDQVSNIVQMKTPDFTALDEALTAMAAFDARMSQVVELRFFAGLTVEETAETLGLSPETVMREWKMAKMWLLRELNGSKHTKSKRRIAGLPS